MATPDADATITAITRHGWRILRGRLLLLTSITAVEAAVMTPRREILRFRLLGCEVAVGN